MVGGGRIQPKHPPTLQLECRNVPIWEILSICPSPAPIETYDRFSIAYESSTATAKSYVHVSH